MVIGVWRNVPVLGSPSDIRLQTFEPVVNCPLPCTSYGNFKMFKISTSEFGTISMHRWFRACKDEFLAMVIEGVVQGIVYFRLLSFGVIQ